MNTLEVNLRGIDMARGHDELFRGAPEPVVLIAVYAVAENRATLLDHNMVAFAATSRFPSFVDDTLVRSYTSACVERFVVLMAALEEDGGDDIQRVYGAFESSTSLQLWTHEDRDPTPQSLVQLDWAMPQRCELEDETGPFSVSCTSDNWVGASAWVSKEVHPYLDLRLHVRSEDRRNDWTVLLNARRSLKSVPQ